MRGRNFTARLVVTSNCEPCRQWAETVREQLAPIGIAVDIEGARDSQAAIWAQGARFDMSEVSTFQDLSDPVAFLDALFQAVPSSWQPPMVHTDLAAINSLREPAKRVTAAGDLAWRLATKQVPMTAFADQVNGQFIAPRLGCRVFPPFGYGVDLAALCLDPSS
jgi:ABC-type oligopeptide transport system substrate-binding subunit